MQMIIDFPGGAKVDAHFGPFTVPTDQPAQGGGTASAPTPFAVFLSSVGTCAGIYVLGFCRQRGVSTEGMRIVQEPVYDPQTGMVVTIRLDIQLPKDFPEKVPVGRRAGGRSVSGEEALRSAAEDRDRHFDRQLTGCAHRTSRCRTQRGLAAPHHAARPTRVAPASVSDRAPPTLARLPRPVPGTCATRLPRGFDRAKSSHPFCNAGHRPRGTIVHRWSVDAFFARKPTPEPSVRASW